MTDALGKGNPHPVYHNKIDVTINDSPFFERHPIGGGISVNVDWADIGPKAAHGKMTDMGLTVLPIHPALPPGWSVSSISSAQEQNLKESVLEQARQLKADVLLNLVEANQLWPAVQSLATSLPNMAANWKRIRKVIKTASGGYLAWKFGISPVLSDMMAIHRYVPKLKNDLKRHAEGEKSRFSKYGILQMSYAKGDVLDGNIARLSFQGRVLNTPLVRYVVVVKPKIQYQTDLFRGLDGIMSRFASSPASLAWEKIPFSFVADWFVDMRGTLRTLDKALGYSPYDVLSFTRSLTYGVAIDCNWKYYNPCNGNIIMDVSAGTSEYKSYTRSLVDMGANAPTWQPRFGKNQAGISAALIAQQLTKAVR
jgi:hypothetical protein